MSDFDTIVIGAGHNGLVCAAYLAKAGWRVLVLEARDTVGGCASTVDAIGARVNICMCDHILVRSTTIIRDLDLASHGLRYVEVDPHLLALPWSGDPAWFVFTDVERTLDSLAQAHPTQVDGYRRFVADALPAARLTVDIAADLPTPGAVLRTVAKRGGRGASRLLAWSRMSAEAVIRSYISDPNVAAAMLSIAPTVWGVPPDAPGTGPAVLSFALRHLTPAGRPIGGSGAFPEAVASFVVANGSSIRCNARVERVLVERGSVRGIRLDTGEEILSNVVVGAADPHRLFLDWLEGQPPRWANKATPAGYESKLDVVVSRLPRYRDLDHERHGVTDPFVATGLLHPDIDGIRAAHAASVGGHVGEQPVVYANWSSATDPSLVGPGEHLLGLEVIFTPHDLAGGWRNSPEPQRWLRLAAEVFEPGFLDSILRFRVVTPEDFARDFGMSRGYVPSYSGSTMSTLLGRDRELSRYRSDIVGLFVTGGGTFPGAGVWGVAGKNAAKVVISRT